MEKPVCACMASFIFFKVVFSVKWCTKTDRKSVAFIVACCKGCEITLHYSHLPYLQTLAETLLLPVVIEMQKNNIS